MVDTPTQRLGRRLEWAQFARGWVDVATPLPADDATDLRPPAAEESRATARAIAGIVAPPGGLTDTQRFLLEALFPAMTGHRVDLTGVAPSDDSPAELAAVLAHRNAVFRTRGLQVTLLAALVLRPLPPAVADRLEASARELCVDDDMVRVARQFAEGSLALAAADFERNGYAADWSSDQQRSLHLSSELDEPWQVTLDVELAARWAALEDLGPDSLGRKVWELYRARGFAVPGAPGAAPPLLAQHDWVHVLADYGTTVESELEVFAFIARANDDLRAFSLLAMVVSLFETGHLEAGAGLFEASPGHLSSGEEMAIRVADSMRRGALCRDVATNSDSIDFMAMDWFSVAAAPIDELRARWSIPGKSPDAVAAGSVGPWEPGGISPYQLTAGRAVAAADRRRYDGFGAA